MPRFKGGKCQQNKLDSHEASIGGGLLPGIQTPGHGRVSSGGVLDCQNLHPEETLRQKSQVQTRKDSNWQVLVGRAIDERRSEVYFWHTRNFFHISVFFDEFTPTRNKILAEILSLTKRSLNLVKITAEFKPDLQGFCVKIPKFWVSWRKSAESAS